MQNKTGADTARRIARKKPQEEKERAAVRLIKTPPSSSAGEGQDSGRIKTAVKDSIVSAARKEKQYFF